MDENSTRFLIAVTLIKNLGHLNGKKLIASTGSAEAIFSDTTKALSRLKLKRSIIQQIRSAEVLKMADLELAYCQKNNVRILNIYDDSYPYRLGQCEDAPLILYCKGNISFNQGKAISVVGTRSASQYGTRLTSELIKSLSGVDCLITSGLALGIDTAAHEASLSSDLPTVGVVAHGLNRLYPRQNQKLAEEIMEKGALITDFASSSSFLPGNFPARNRIIAGMSDATIVIESGPKGGSLITADLAHSYNRDVFAFPGRVGDKGSEGCLKLIKENKAALIENASDLLKAMNWDILPLPKQTQLFTDLNEIEEDLVSLLRQNEPRSLDEISSKLGLPVSKTASLTLELEFRNIIKSLPGKLYVLNT